MALQTHSSSRDDTRSASAIGLFGAWRQLRVSILFMIILALVATWAVASLWSLQEPTAAVRAERRLAAEESVHRQFGLLPVVSGDRKVDLRILPGPAERK